MRRQDLDYSDVHVCRYDAEGAGRFVGFATVATCLGVRERDAAHDLRNGSDYSPVNHCVGRSVIRIGVVAISGIFYCSSMHVHVCNQESLRGPVAVVPVYDRLLV